MPRDRAATRARILAAAEQLIARDGCRAIGVNAVAAEAGVDKVLLYRYFGGIDGVVATLARERRLWPEASARALDESSLAGALRVGILDEARELEQRPLARAVLAGSLAERSELTAQLASSRGREHESLLAALRERFHFPPYVDVPALAALLSAGVAYLAMHSDAGTPWLGVDLRNEAGRRRIEKTLGVVTRAVLGSAE